MGVFEENTSVRPPGMHWQQHQHERYVGPAYDPSRDLSPNLPACDAITGTAASMQAATREGAIDDKSGILTPTASNNNNNNNNTNNNNNNNNSNNNNSSITSINNNNNSLCGGRQTPCSGSSSSTSSSSSTTSSSSSSLSSSSGSGSACSTPNNNNNNNQPCPNNNPSINSSCAVASAQTASDMCRIQHQEYHAHHHPHHTHHTHHAHHRNSSHFHVQTKLEPPSTPPPPPSSSNSQCTGGGTSITTTGYCGPGGGGGGGGGGSGGGADDIVDTKSGIICSGGNVTMCAGCGQHISDRFYLQAVDRRWHVACLQCCQCHLMLESDGTCFSRDGNIYCKKDYYRLFCMKRCARCQAAILSSELVMRARDLVFHVHCFTCAICNAPLTKGDHFGMRDTAVLCRIHYEMSQSHTCPSTTLNDEPISGSIVPGPLPPCSSGNDMSPSTTGASFISGTPFSGGHHHGLHGPPPPPSILHSHHPFQSRPFPVSPVDFPHHPHNMSPHHQMSPGPSIGPGGGSGSCGVPTSGSGTGQTQASVVSQQTSPSSGVVDCSSPNKVPSTQSFFNGAPQVTVPRQKGRPRKRKPKDLESMTANLDLNSDYLDMPFGRSPGTPGMHHHSSSQRTKRMRTSFKHHQLRTMKSYFAINHNPDAKDLKQLSQKTGLPKRVLQVWFQNARAKWRRMMQKQEGCKSGGDGVKCSDPSGIVSDLDLYPGPPHGPGSLTGSIQSLPPHSPQFILGPGSPNSLDCP